MVMDSYASRKGYTNEYKDYSPDYISTSISDPTSGQVLLIPDDSTLSSFQFDVYNLNFKPQQGNWEYYQTGVGQQSIRKQCDKYAELSFNVLVSDDLVKAYVYDGEPRRPLNDTSQFLQYRSNFFSEFRGIKCWVISSMFPDFNGVIDSIEYDIDAGETDAVYKITIKQFATGVDHDVWRMIHTNTLTGTKTTLVSTINSTKPTKETSVQSNQKIQEIDLSENVTNLDDAMAIASKK